MFHLRKRRATSLGLALIVASLVVMALLTPPLSDQAAEAAPAPQAQASPVPTLRPSPTPTRGPDQEMQDLEVEKLRREIALLREQRDMVSHQQEIDSQFWRAPAALIQDIGPTLIGLGLLYLAARAVNHFVPPPPPREQRPAPEEDDEDEI